MSDPLALRNAHPLVSRVPSRHGNITVELEGPQVGSWMLDHQNDESIADLGMFILAGGPDFSVRYTASRARGRAQGPIVLTGRVVLRLPVDRADFANTFEAAQIALERLAQLPDARYLRDASMRLEIEADR